MDDERWAHLVARLEREAQEDPRGYRRKLVVISALGYAYILAALLVLVGLAVAVAVVAIAHFVLLFKLLLPLGALFLVILRSFAVRIEPPEGMEVTRAEAPELFRTIDEVGAAVRGPALEGVLLDGDMNAGVQQVPRFGIFGSRNFLVLGLPLLQAVTPTELRAVVAHELAHLSRSHGRVNVWLYRIRATWGQLLESLEERKSVATRVFRLFFEWYVPRFNAHALPLMRAHEFEADRVAAGAVGAEALASALSRIAVADTFLERRYWPAVFARAADEPAPPSTAFTQIAGRIRDAAGDESAAAWLAEALEREPEPGDSHPSIAQRLHALGISAPVPPGGADERAADIYLGGKVSSLCGRLDVRWQREVARLWASNHEQALTERARLGELEERRDSLEPDELLELAHLVEDHRGEEEALELVRRLLSGVPDHAVGRYTAGRLLLRRGDDAGLRELDRAMELDPDAVIPACQIAISYLTEQRRGGEAERYETRFAGRLEDLAQAFGERQTFTIGDPVEPTALPVDAEADLRRVVAGFPEIERAYLGKLKVDHLADELPVYVVLAVARKPGRQERAPALVTRLAEAVELPGETFVVVRQPRSRDVESFEAQVPEPFYRRVTP